MDPTLLPEPNHVVLNHTFTLSIRVSKGFQIGADNNPVFI